MRNLLTLCLTLVLSTAAFSFANAQSSTAVDGTDIAKDQAAIAKAETDIERDRAQKAEDKADGNWAGQAVDSLALGYDHIFHTEKSGEKSADTIIVNHQNSQ